MSDNVEEYTCQEVYVNFKKVLGSGSFGTVYKGRLNGDGDVAVKVIKGNRESIEEIVRMKNASGHENILELIGTVPPENHYIETCHKLTRNSTWLVMEYMENGNLHSYMRNYAGGIPVYGMIKIAHQVALGMDHLHRRCKMLHMDLAARNVLVADDSFHVKIGDIGVCRNYDYSDQYFNCNDFVCPVRWMPPENHPNSYNEWTPHFSRKGDVWSFGVLLFEIWTRGKLPFAGLDNEEVMEMVGNGYNVLDYHQHDFHARLWVKELMEECFSFNKEERPNFRDIYNTTSEYLEHCSLGDKI